MITRDWTDRYKRCPKCQARILRHAELCRHCGLSMPISFPPNPVVSGEARKAMLEVAEAMSGANSLAPEIMGRYLVIVARDRRDLYEYLRASFTHEPTIHVLLERRVADRRRRPGSPPLDRRRKERRTRPMVDARMRAFGFAIVRTC